MEIILAKQAGFCFGVKRATKIAFESAENAGDTYTLGPIIHSPQVVKRLEDLGVQVINDISEMDSGTIIIRSHGVTAQELDAAMSKGFELIDATCPFVKKAQEHVKYLSSAGYSILVVGDVDHPEVQGIVSYASGKVNVVNNGSEVAKLALSGKIGIVAQTTQSVDNLKSVVDACLELGGEIRVFNTICDATTVRQDEAKEIAGQVDCMIVIGGYNSANTRRLAEICTEIQRKTYHIENSQQLDVSWFAGAKRVGVTAGASTPKWLIDEVLLLIENLPVDKIR
jgi:4-hydroxy-3-methylbut-2-enyl diphosphate reductase